MVPTLSIENLQVEYALGGDTIAAVREVSLVVAPRECVGIVGESGSGKTQVFMAAMGLLAGSAHARGSVRFDGMEILGMEPKALNRVRGAKLTMIFQDPMTSLTPHLRIGVQLAEVLVEHRGSSWREAQRAALHALERVRVPEPARRLRQYPHELSGGMRQRVMIAASLMCEPALLIADEPTTALDVTVQAQIMDLLRALRLESGMSIALISHDLGVVAGLAERIVVMYAGRVVESARAADLLRSARHPYTRSASEVRTQSGGGATRSNAVSAGPATQSNGDRARLRIRAPLPAGVRALPRGAAGAAPTRRGGASGVPLSVVRVRGLSA